MAYISFTKEEFLKLCRETPSWTFLRWINQIMSLINNPESEVIKEKVIDIAIKYP